MGKLANVHPGEILNYEFLEPLEITAYRLSKDLKIPQTRISEIIKGNRRITADTALRLSKLGSKNQLLRWKFKENIFNSFHIK